LLFTQNIKMQLMSLQAWNQPQGLIKSKNFI
jgi:hypothetical protein